MNQKNSTSARSADLNTNSVISFFAGCGGSSTGYKQAGCNVKLAVDWEKSAVAIYRKNHPDTNILQADIRDCKGADIMAKAGLTRELDILDGSPPCTPFSVAGLREKSWGVSYAHTGDTKQQITTDLFSEYIRLASEIKPKVVIAENVHGLIRGATKAYFKQFMASFYKAGYLPRAYDVDAADFGVPQSRRRIIIIAVRRDLPLPKNPLKKATKRMTVRDALAGVVNTPEEIAVATPAVDTAQHAVIPYIKPGHSQKTIDGRGFAKRRHRWDRPAYTLLASSDTYHPDENRNLTINELKRLGGFPDDYWFPSRHAAVIRIGNAVAPPMMKHIALYVQKEILLGNGN